MRIYLFFGLSAAIFFVFLSYYILHTTYNIPTVHAQDPCANAAPGGISLSEGLVTGKTITDSTLTSGPCLQGDETNILLEQGKIRADDYETLRSIFYTQSKAAKGETINNGKLPNFSGSKIYSSDLNTNVKITGGPPSAPSSAVAVIFIDGVLDIDGDVIFRTTDPDSGIVFVVKNDINIKPTVEQIDAVLISSGRICTAATGNPCHTQSYQKTDPLIINGGLISLNPDKPIDFKRTLDDNSAAAAEQINAQPKYLIILKGLFSKDLIAPF